MTPVPAQWLSPAEWLTKLGLRCAAGLSEADAEERIREYLPDLMDRFPAAAFTRASLEAVSAACTFWPSYGELVQRLSAWWRVNRPYQLALPAPPSAVESPRPEDAAERARVADEFRAAFDAMLAELHAGQPGARGAAERPPPRVATPDQLIALYRHAYHTATREDFCRLALLRLDLLGAKLVPDRQ